MEGRQPRADRKRHRHDAARREPRDIDDFATLQDRRRTRFLELFAQLPHQRRSLFDPALRRQIGKAQPQNAGRQREGASVLRHIAELRERAQNAPRGRARKAGDPGRFRQGHRRPLLVESAEQRQAFGERRHELLVLRLVVRVVLVFIAFRVLRHRAANSPNPSAKRHAD